MGVSTMSDTARTLNQVIARLEQVTARLEKLEAAGPSGSSSSASAPAAASTGGSTGAGDSSASVKGWDDLIDSHFRGWSDAGKKIGGKLAEQLKILDSSVAKERAFLVIAAESKKPSDDVLGKLASPVKKCVEQIIAVREENRADKLFNDLSTISEGIGALGWILITPTPSPYVSSMYEQAQFYGNRVIKEFKGKDQNQVNFAQGWFNFLKELAKYVKQYHTTGVTWNPKGGDASSRVSEADSADDGAPPPPSGGPPPPPDVPEVDTSAADKAASARSGLLDALNKGSDITKGLRKVKREDTNKDKKISGVVKTEPKKASTTSRFKKAPAKTLPPKLTLEGNKWLVEYQVSNKSIVISDTQPKHSIYIYKCTDSVVQVKGKVNAILLDGCKKVGLVFEDVISGVESVNCQSIQVQCTGKSPVFTVDKTDGYGLYLSKDCLGAEIITSKSSEMNVSLPGDGKDADMIEIPIPEQFKTVIKDKTLVTETVSHAGG